MEDKRRNNFFKIIALVSILGSGAYLNNQAHAQGTAETKATLEDIKGQEGQKDVDELITNKKLRAETGSKSKVSVTTAFSYSGGSVKSPGSKLRPFIKGGSDAPILAALGGELAGKYRLGERSALSAGVGVQMYTPFHAPLSETKVVDAKGKENKRSDFSNPYLEYTHLDRLNNGLQSVSSIRGSIATVDFYTRKGNYADLSVTQSFVKDIGTSGLSFGVALMGGLSLFNKFTPEAKEDTSDYSVGVYPSLEYVFNDTFNFRTVSGLWVYEHMRTANGPWTFVQNKIYQSVGIGISVTRDIFLYPNVQFLPENIRSDLTNVALNANINIF